LQQGNFTTVIITTVISCVLIVAGFLKKDKILILLNGGLHKKNESIELKEDLEASILK
jgi:hypothetical protein